jgi:hypothetical protein
MNNKTKEMEVLRQVGQFKLNKGSLMANGLYNVTNDILLDYTKDKGCSLWFDEETKDNLMMMSDSDFVQACKQKAGNDINCIEVAKNLWSELGDIPINEQEELEEDFITPFIVFEKGADREDVWHWFEDYFDLSVAEDLMNLK